MVVSSQYTEIADFVSFLYNGDCIAGNVFTLRDEFPASLREHIVCCLMSVMVDRIDPQSKTS